MCFPCSIVLGLKFPHWFSMMHSEGVGVGDEMVNLVHMFRQQPSLPLWVLPDSCLYKHLQWKCKTSFRELYNVPLKIKPQFVQFIISMQVLIKEHNRQMFPIRNGVMTLQLKPRNIFVIMSAFQMKGSCLLKGSSLCLSLAYYLC